MQIGDIFYRVVDGCDPESKPVLQKLYVVKITQHGCWVVHSWAYPLRVDQKPKDVCGKLIITGTRRAYAYPTIELAVQSYKIRKQKQIGHAKAAIERAEHALEHIANGVLESEYGELKLCQEVMLRLM